MKKIVLGDNTDFFKTISKNDVYNFAGICDDFNSVHINKVEAIHSKFEKRE